MARMADLRARISRIYHFTDRRNLPSIREHEGIFSLELLESAKTQVAVLGLHREAVNEAERSQQGLRQGRWLLDIGPPGEHSLCEGTTVYSL